MSRVVIASICPWPVRIERPHFQPQTVFEIPAVKRGDPPAVLTIEDQVVWEKLLSTKPPIPHTIRAEEIAADFLLHVSMNGPWMTAEARPAVWRCAGYEPTPQEIAENLEKLSRYCDLVVEEADDWDRRRKTGEPRVPKITPRMKECARFRLYDREWLSDFTVNALKLCPFCATTVASIVVKCPMCNEVIDKERYKEMKQPTVTSQFQPKQPLIPSQPVAGK